MKNLLALVCFCPAIAFAAGEVNGRIRGVVTEADSGAPVPGATITATSAALIGGAQVVTTNDDGAYELVELPGGKYKVEVAYAGVKPIERTVFVRQGETLPLDIQWSAELANTEVTEVQAERHMTRPDSTQTGTVISADTESKLATQRTYTDVALQVAGTKADGSLFAVKGANRLQNHYIVDGMDTTDVVTGSFAAPVNFDAISSMEIITGGMEAQYNALGGVINVNTLSGSDEFHVDTSFYVNNQAFSANNLYGAQGYEGQLAFNPAPAGPTQGYKANATISGAIIKQKLWYSLSLEYDYSESSLQPGPPIGLQHPPRIEHDFYPRLKLSWAPSQKNRVTVSVSGSPAFILNRGQSNKYLGVAEDAQIQGGFFSVLQWDYFLSQNVTTNLQTGFNYDIVHTMPMCQFDGGKDIDFGPRSAQFSDMNYKCNINQPEHINEVDQTSWYNYSSVNDNKRDTIQFDPSVSIRGKGAGEHDLKFGFQTRFAIDTFSHHTPGGSTYLDNDNGSNGLGLEGGLCDPNNPATTNCANSERVDSPDYSQREYGFGLGGFIQDRWKVNKRLTILPGMRIDYGNTRNTINQLVTEGWGYGPRLGAAFDLTGDQKTILSAYYGRANDVLSLLPSQFADITPPSAVNVWSAAANGGAGGFVFQSQTGGSGAYVLDPHSTPPHTDEVTVTVNREFFRDSLAAISYTYKHEGNLWEEVEVNQIWDPTGERIVGYVNGKPQAIMKFTTPNSAVRDYHGIDFTAESRPTPNWDLYAGYTLSWLYGTASDDVNELGYGNPYANPRQTMFYNGYLPEDARHNIKLHASYSFHGLTAGMTANYTSGGTITKLYWNAAHPTSTSTSSYQNLRSPQGTDPSAPNDPNQVSEFRTPDVIIFNLRVSYDFHELTKQRIIIIADLFNLFNFDTATGYNAQDTATFGTVSGRISPLRLQLALRYMF